MMTFQEWWDIHDTTLTEYDVAKLAWEAGSRNTSEEVYDFFIEFSPDMGTKFIQEVNKRRRSKENDVLQR